MGCAGNGARQHHLLRERLQRQRLRCCYVRLRARMAVLLTVFLSQLTVFLSLHGVQPLHYQTQYLGGVSITTYCVFIRRAFHGAWLCSYRNNCCVHIVFMSSSLRTRRPRACLFLTVCFSLCVSHCAHRTPGASGLCALCVSPAAAVPPN